MIKREIPKEDWSRFAEDFSRENSGRIVKVEVTDDEDYRIDYAESLPFGSLRSVNSRSAPALIIEAGKHSSFSHTIDDTMRIVLEVEQEKIKLLLIESSLGRKAVIRFHPLADEDDLK